MKNSDSDNFSIVTTREQAEKITADFEKAQGLLKFLNKEIATVQQTLQTYRTINHWDTLGLLSRKSDSNTWRKFSITDLFWINIIDSLRDFGYPIEKIKIVKSQLFNKSAEKNIFYRYILDVLTLEKDWNILIYPEGKIYFQDSLMSLNNRDGVNFIRINLYEVLEKILKNKKMDSISPTLKKEELSLLLNIRKGDFKEIVIKLKNGQIERFETKEDVDVGIRAFNTIKELMKGPEYQEILIKKQGGKIVSIENTEKIREDMS